MTQIIADQTHFMQLGLYESDYGWVFNIAATVLMTVNNRL